MRLTVLWVEYPQTRPAAKGGTTVEDKQDRYEQTEPKDEDVEGHRLYNRLPAASDEGEESEGEDFEAHRLQHGRNAARNAAKDEGGDDFEAHRLQND